MTSVIIECSRNNSDTQISNASWVNKFDPVPITDGTQIALKTAFIDTKKQNPGMINIEHDSQVDIKVGYYTYVWDQSDTTTQDNMYFNPYNKYQLFPAAPETYHRPNYSAFGKFYSAWHWGSKPFDSSVENNDCYPIENTISVTVKADEYSPDELARYITDQWAQLTLDSNLPDAYFQPESKWLITSNVATNQHITHFWELKNTAGGRQPSKEIDNGFVYSTYTSNVGLDPNQDNLVAKAEDYFTGCSMPSLEYDQLRERFKLNIHTPIYNDNAPPPALSTAIINLKGDGKIYTHGVVDIIDTTRVEVTDKVTSIVKDALAVGKIVTLVWQYDGFRQTNMTVTESFPTYSPEVKDTVKFNQALHLPNAGFEVVIEATSTSHLDMKSYWRQAKQSSGVFITDLTSNVGSFWQQIGFDKANCSAPIATGNTQPNYSQFLNSVTNTYQGLNSLIAKSGNLYVKPNRPTELPNNDGSDPLYISADGDTNDSIVADNYDTSSKNSQAYYLIECESVFQTDTINDKSNKKDIIGICSKQYQASDYITCYSDSAVPYMHTGTSQLMSTVKIRITDPDGSEPESLGKNHSVILEVIKPPLSKK